MPRFVLLKHEMPDASKRATHWDLMLEHDGKLLTWALPRPLAQLEVEYVERLADHRLHYLDYEGPVSGDRGTVARVESGRHEILEFGDDRIVARLSDATGECHVRLAKVDDGQRWRLTVVSS